MFCGFKSGSGTLMTSRGVARSFVKNPVKIKKIYLKIKKSP